VVFVCYLIVKVSSSDCIQQPPFPFFPLCSLYLGDLCVNPLTFYPPAIFNILKITGGNGDYTAVVIGHFDLTGNHV